MPLEKKTVTRRFKFNGRTFPDPNPALTPEMVKAQLAVSDPQLASAVIEGPTYDGDVATYTFTCSVGTKGQTMPKAGPVTRDHRARGAESTPAPRRLPRAERGSQRHRNSTTTPERQRRTRTPTERQPTHAGLTLPKLTAPTTYTLAPDRIRNARLAQDLLEHNVIDADDLDLNEDIPAAIANALAKAMTPEDPTGLHLTAHLRREDDQRLRLYLVPELDSDTFLNAHALTQQLDALDTRLAPALLALVDRAHHLTPIYTPGAAYDTVINLHWNGDDTGEEALEELRYEMAHERGIKPDEILIEEAKALANSQYLTPDTLEKRLPRRYYEAHSRTLRTPELLKHLGVNLFPNTLGTSNTSSRPPPQPQNTPRTSKSTPSPTGTTTTSTRTAPNGSPP